MRTAALNKARSTRVIYSVSSLEGGRTLDWLSGRRVEPLGWLSRAARQYTQRPPEIPRSDISGLDGRRPRAEGVPPDFGRNLRDSRERAGQFPKNRMRAYASLDS